MKTKTILGLAIILIAGVVLFMLTGRAPSSTSVVQKQQTTAANVQAQPAPIANQTSAATQNQAASSTTLVGAARKFSSIPPLERSALLMQIRKQDLLSILQLWLDAGRIDHDLMKQSALTTTLIFAMRERAPNPELLVRMQGLLEDKGSTSQEKAGVLGILAGAATKESVDLLLSAATSLADEELRRIAVSDVGQVGIAVGGGQRLSPALERVWRESDDRALLISVAEAMAKIGSSSGVELLISAVLTGGGADETRKFAARSALPDIYKKDSVPPLAARLVDQTSDSDAAKLVAPLLVRVGDASASAAVVTWLRGVSEDATPLIRERLFQETRTPAMLAAWKAAIDPAVAFRNELNREAIRAGLVSYSEGHTFQK